MSKPNSGQMIRKLRSQRAWTQAQLAAVAGVSTRTIQRLETRGTASSETMMAIANAFDMDVAGLLPTSPNLPINDDMEIPENPQFARKTLLWGGALYIALVLAAITIAFIFFPNDAYPLWIDGSENPEAVQYRKYLQSSALVLAMMLGFWSAFYGAVSKKLLWGLAALAVGLIISLGAYSVLPWLHYPHDQYSPGAIWLFVGLVPFVLAWGLVNAGFLVMRKL